MRACYIILNDRVLLSKKHYADWREIENEYWEHYKTNFPPLTHDELLQYFEDDYKNESDWPFSRSQMAHFFGSEDMILCSMV